MFRLDPSCIGKAWPAFMWSVFLVAALGCSWGFKVFVWFMSVGYGFAIMAIGLYHLVYGLINSTMTVATAVMSVLFMVYGYRLGGFLLKRQLTSKEYQKTLDSTGSTSKVPLFVSVVMWICLSFLYVAETSSVTYRIINRAQDNVFAWLGIIIMAIAIYGEATADAQKSAAKKKDPHRFADQGLYRFCRCPNYFSEILYWVGVTVSGIGSTCGRQWIVVIFALVAIIYIMCDSAKRLELRHEKNYGLDKEYQKYSDTVPLLFPFTRMYHSMKVYRD